MLPLKLTDEQSVRLCHACFGHSSLKRMVQTLKDEKHTIVPFQLTKGFMAELVKFSNIGCDICAATCMKRKPVGDTHSASAPVAPEQLAMQTLHKGQVGAFDVKGPYPVTSLQHNFIYLGMLKLKTSGVRYLAGMKVYTSETTIEQLQIAQSLYRRYIGELHVLRLDNIQQHRTDELMLYLADGGTAPEFSAPYVHEQMPVERDWQTITRTALSGMRHGGAPKAAWFDAVRDANYKEERISVERPKTDDLCITAFERLTTQKPNHELMLPFWTPCRYFLDIKQRDDKLDETGRAAFFAGPSPENGAKPYVYDGHVHHTAGGGFQPYFQRFFDSNAKNNKRLEDKEWTPTEPVAPPHGSAPPSDLPGKDARRAAGSSADAQQPLPLSKTKPTRAKVQPTVYAPGDKYADRRIDPKDVDSDRAMRAHVLASLAGPTVDAHSHVGTLCLLVAHEQQILDGNGDGDASDLMDEGVMAACMTAGLEISEVVNLGLATELGANDEKLASYTFLAAAHGDMRIVRVKEGLSLSLPRHYGDYMKSPEKGLWWQRKKVELERLDSIGVWDRAHESELPAEYEGPYHLVWAYAIRPNNIVKGLAEVLRPRVCVGRLAKGGVETTDDPLSKFATTTDFLTTSLMLATTAADGWIDFAFDIHQFHQSTLIPEDAKPIVTYQPRGAEERGPNGEPANEMYRVLRKQMQGTKTASSMANAQLDALLAAAGFQRTLGDSRLFVLKHDEYGRVRLAMLSDDGLGAAEKEIGIKYTLDQIERVYALSHHGPWQFHRGFEVWHDRNGMAGITATRMIEEGIEELMPGELRYRPSGPCSTNIKKLELDPVPTEGEAGYARWAGRVAWFRKAAGWAIHTCQVHDAALFTLSELCGKAKSPSEMCVKEMKHMLCWLYEERFKGRTYGKPGGSSLKAPPIEQIKKELNDPTAPVPFYLHLYIDSDLAAASRWSVVVMLNGAPIMSRTRLQHSIAIDITDAESYAYSVGGVLAELIRGRLEDIGHAELTVEATPIGTDNDATLRIASDAASAKRALHILRRMGHVRWATDMKMIVAIKMDRTLNLSDVNTHYCTKEEHKRAEPKFRGLTVKKASDEKPK